MYACEFLYRECVLNSMGLLYLIFIQSLGNPKGLKELNLESEGNKKEAQS